MTAGTRRRRRGMALVMVLASLLFLGIVLGGLTFFSSSEKGVLDKILSQKSLIYLTRSGLGLAEAKLLEGRWYAPSSEGLFEYESPNGYGHVKIFVDDYIRKKTKKVDDEEISLLDHIKVTVVASYRKEHMYGFGKFVISPEPKYDANGSTRGINPIHPRNKAGKLQEATTLRKLINLKILTSEEVEAIPGFSSAELVDSRKALAAYLKDDQMEYAKNYSRNRLLSRNIQKQAVSQKSVFTVEEFRNRLKQLDSYQGPQLGHRNESETWLLKNTFLAEVLKHFFLATDWDIGPAAKARKLQDILVALGSLPVKTKDPEVREAITLAVGAGHPKDVVEGIDYIATFTPDSAKTAAENFLTRRGFATIPDTLSPTAFAAALSEVHTSNAYKFYWQGEVTITYIGTGTPTTPSGATTEIGGAGKFILFHHNKGQIYKVENDYEYKIDNCVILGISGPNAGFSGYYMVNQVNQQKLPLFTILNFFLKFIDETTDTDPIEIHNWDSWSNTIKIKIDDKTEKEETVGEVFGVY